MKKNIKNLARSAMAAIMILPSLAKANDIFIGTRGPTEWQADLRLNYIKKKDSNGIVTKTFANNDVLKYWNGDKLGIFSFINIPAYKSIDNGSLKNEGFGDLVLGAGPRGKLDFGDKGSHNFISYAAVSLPTGDTESKPNLGNDRTDIKTGAFYTYLTKDKRFEVDGSFEYTFAGTSSKGVKGLDEISGGIILGGRVTDNNLVRLAAGINTKFRESNDGNWNYTIGPRAVLRLTLPNKKWHFELIGDYDACTKNLPKGFGLTSQLRINFP